MAKIEHIKNKRGEVIYPVSKEGAIYDENGVLLSTKIATFITRLVDNLANYYLKSETYTKGEVDNLIGAIQGFTYIVVSELPAASAETMGIVYLVPSEDPQTQNVKDEYITIRSGVEGSYTYSWEQIGSTAIDLSGYVTTEALNTALADYTTTANLTTLLAAKQDTIADLSTIRSGAAAGATAYQKPGTGIPATDMASGVQTSLGKADSAYQKPSGGIPKTDLESGVQGSLELADTAVQADPIGSIVPPVDPSEFATKEEVEGLEAKVTEINGQFGEPIRMEVTFDGYYDTKGAVGSTVPAPTAHATNKSSKYAVSPGDMLVVYGKGGYTPRLWCFVDSTNKILANAAQYSSQVMDWVIAPNNSSYVIVNFVSDQEGPAYIYRANTFKNEVDSSLQYMAKEKAIVQSSNYTADTIMKTSGETASATGYCIVKGIVLQPGEQLVLNNGNDVYCGTGVAVVFKTDSSENWTETLVFSSHTSGYSRKISYTNNTASAQNVGICTKTNERTYTIQKYIDAASLSNYGYCTMVAADNPSATAGKVIARDDYFLDPNTILVARLYPSNTADSVTLNINNTGAKDLYYNGSRASSTNTWDADTYVVLWYDGVQYQMFPLNDSAIRKLIASFGVTSDPYYNNFLKELYLVGIDQNTDYLLSYVRKDSTAWGFSISAANAVGTKLAAVTITNDAGKVAFVKVEERNSSGISGYAIVDWTKLHTTTGDEVHYSIHLNNPTVGTLDLNPAILSHILNDGTVEETKHNGDNWQEVYTLAQNILADRPYFLNKNYEDEVSYDDTSYLDAKIRSIPDGKHFLFSTDSHIDYYRANLSQKETQIMRYVKSKLGAGCIVFGGDAIGQQDTQYKAAKVLSVFAEDKFNAFGPDFIWCQGNHDANANIDTTKRILSTEIYKRTTKEMGSFGKIVFDTEGLAIIDTLGLSSDDAAEAKAWMNLHYYIDDERNKIRFIVVETGDGSPGATVIGNTWNGWENMIGYNTFIGDALQTTPDGYDVVLVAHQLAADANFSDSAQVTPGKKGWANVWGLLSAFKNRDSITITYDGAVTSSKPVLYALMNERIGDGKTYDFSNRTSGRTFIISGHFHIDDAWVLQNTNPPSVWNYVGKEYGEWDTVLGDAILAIQVDRSCIYERNGSMAGSAKAPNATSYPNQVIEGQVVGEQRFGTKNEVLFDVVTITPDNKIVCTRIGAGNDREYTLP